MMNDFHSSEIHAFWENAHVRWWFGLVLCNGQSPLAPVDNHNHSGRLLHVCCSYESPPQLILYVHNKKSTAHSMVFILYISHWRSPSHITHSYLFLWLCPSHATKIWRTLNSPVRRIMQLTDSIIVLAGTMAPVCPAKWFAVGYFPASHIEYLRVFLYCWWLWITGRQWWSSL